MAKKPNCKQRVHAPGIALGAGFLLAFASGLTFRANAQIEVFKPLHLSRVQGVVADTSGRPVANAEVALVGDPVGDEAVGFKTTTDDAGRFALDQASGRYWLRVSGSRYSPAAREVVIGPDLETLFHKPDLYVMLGPGSCNDACSSIYTSRKKFDRAVRWNTGHYY